MTTLNEALDVLNKVKKEFAAARSQWKEREVELVTALREERQKHVPKEKQEVVSVLPSRDEIKAELMTEVLSVIDVVIKESDDACATWEKLSKEERTTSSHELRLRAHPFTAAILSEIRERLLKI